MTALVINYMHYKMSYQVMFDYMRCHTNKLTDNEVYEVKTIHNC